MDGSRVGTASGTRPGTGRRLIVALAAVVVAHHVATLFLESINWDELALFRRAADTVSTGSLRGGGRPGLASLSLVPLVSGCTDPLRVALVARGLWALMTIAYVAGLFELVRRALRSTGPTAWHAAALAAGMLVLVPVFMRWSLQVRTDQIALVCGAWGGVALLESRSRLRWALIAGALFGLGYLSTQKLLYIGALVALLCAGAQWLERDFSFRRELQRGALLLAGAGAVVGAFHAIIPLLYEPQPSTSWDAGMNTFAFYRANLGYRVYAGMLPTLMPHLVMGGLLAMATVARIRRADSRRRLALAWTVVAMGVGLGMFHAGAFPYFWMTIGAFPALATALALPDVLAMLGGERARRCLLAGLWLLLVVPTLPPALALLEDTQEVQRDAYAFVERNFAPDDRGFHPEGGLFCRRDPEPLPVMFSAAIFAVYHGERGPEATRALIEEFRSRPIKFLLESFRLRQYPRPFRIFLDDHYVLYGPAVMVPGHRLAGLPGARHVTDTFVAGDYRWELPARHPPARIEVDGRGLGPGDTVSLGAGAHRIVLLDEVQAGILVLAVERAPLAATEPFYNRGALEEFTGR